MKGSGSRTVLRAHLFSLSGACAGHHYVPPLIALIFRTAYPPYGLFILNRAGMYDYIHLIHPEDEIQPEGEYLMYRSYPEFTAKRLAMAKSAHPTLTECWTDARRRTPSAIDPLTNWRYLLNQKPDKGRDETVMFWFLGSESEQHEPLSDTMERQVHVSVQLSTPS
jgi:Dcp1-like decapping family